MWINILLLAFSAVSQDQWLCVEDSSQVREGEVIACGVGENLSEGAARREAFEDAKFEFNQVCGPDTACGLHKYAVKPQRAACEKKDGLWKCYRLVVFRFEGEKRREIASQNTIPSQSVGTVGVSNQEMLDRIFYLGLGGR